MFAFEVDAGGVDGFGDDDVAGVNAQTHGVRVVEGLEILFGDEGVGFGDEDRGESRQKQEGKVRAHVPCYTELVRLLAVAADKFLRRGMSGTADASIRFDQLCGMLKALGFEKRVRGSHHVFRKGGVATKIDLQKDGDHAKPYPVKQVRAAILEAKLRDE